MQNQNKEKITLLEILKPIELYLASVDNEIKKKLITGISNIDESTSHLSQRGGKKIRASLTILSSGLKNEIPDDIVEMATAVETVHAAALIHDDIIDQSLLRRGDPTVPQQKGNKIAVLIGDYMYTRALLLATNEDQLDFYREMINAAAEMIRGELYQLEYSGIDEISKEHYFKIIENKTAKFMGICAKIGAIKSEMTEEEKELIYQFGFNLGIAFQIIDDTIDVTDNKEMTGKESGNDFMEGKITLPFLRLLDISDNEERELLVNYARKPDHDKWKIIQQKIDQSDSINYCINAAEEYSKKAIQNLDYFPPSINKETLINLTNFLITRKF